METRINLVFQFAPEKLGRFESKGYTFLVFLNVLFFPIRPRAKLVRFPVVYDYAQNAGEIDSGRQSYQT
jgi:hypothetical protein